MNEPDLTIYIRYIHNFYNNNKYVLWHYCYTIDIDDYDMIG